MCKLGEAGEGTLEGGSGLRAGLKLAGSREPQKVCGQERAWKDHFGAGKDGDLVQQ